MTDRISVNVLGQDYEIRVKKMAKDLFGDCDTDKKVIRVNKAKDDFAGTLVHEVIHAALAESGLHHLLINEGLEEAIVRAVEHGLRSADLIPEVTINDFMDPERGGNHGTDDGLAEHHEG